jgi:hypothetical protein
MVVCSTFFSRFCWSSFDTLWAIVENDGVAHRWLHSFAAARQSAPPKGVTPGQAAAGRGLRTHEKLPLRTCYSPMPRAHTTTV